MILSVAYEARTESSISIGQNLHEFILPNKTKAQPLDKTKLKISAIFLWTHSTAENKHQSFDDSVPLWPQL